MSLSTASAEKHTLGKRSTISDRKLPYLLIAPTVLLWLAFILYPMLNVFGLSIQNFSYAKIYSNGYVGLENFKRVLTQDPMFWNSLVVSLKWVFFGILFQFIIGMVAALCLNQNIKCKGLFRSVTFAPWAVSGVLTTMLWLLMYNQHIGVINYVLKAIGAISANVAWLAEDSTVFAAVLLAEIWRCIPFFAINFLAGLQSIDMDIYEAADIDGCGKVKMFFYITLPFLKETIVLTTLLRCIWSFNSFDMIFTMTNGGPYGLTTTLPIYIFNTAIVSGDFGYGAALSIMAFLILLVFAVVYMKVTKYGGGINEG